MRGILVTMLVGALCISPAAAVQWYVRGEATWNKVDMDSGGRNTLGPHENTGKSDDTGHAIGLGMGLKVKDWRFGLDIARHDEYAFTTNSFQPPTPTFFYDSEIELKTYMLSGNWEIVTRGKWTLFIGLNAGFAKMDADTDDTVVTGSENESEFIWGADAGMGVQVSAKNYIDFAYRHLDSAELSIPLEMAGGIDAGELTADLDAHQFLVGWRWMFH